MKKYISSLSSIITISICAVGDNILRKTELYVRATYDGTKMLYAQEKSIKKNKV